MPRMLTRTILSVAMVWLFVAGPLHGEDLFPDKALEAAVRAASPALHGSTKALVQDDVRQISSLTATSAGIRLLKGLEACSSLREIRLDGNAIDDLTPLRGLRDLQSLDVSRNQIQDIGPLAELRELQYLQADHNEISDVRPLAELTQLNALYLEHNAIEDISPLAELKKLWSLYLDHNRVKDVSPLAKLRGIDSLGLAFNHIEDISPLADLRPRMFLFLQGNKIEDITPLVLLAEKDRAGENETARFWRVYLGGNPLSEQSREIHVRRLIELGAKEVNLDDPKKKQAPH